MNLLVPLVLDGPETELARDVYSHDPEWGAPILWRSELCSVLAKHMRTRSLGLSDAWQALATAESLLVDQDFVPSGERVLQLKAGSRCSAYDCEYVVIALVLGVPLVTSDRQLLREFPHVAVSPRAFVRRRR